ncbi:MAG TPA: hypothetical protein VE401_08225 [Solirubrobacterales bacterium]|nr:hypothetical protein [Solirubrobacterales bacterium]
MEIIERDSLDGLFDALSRRGYTLVGPTVSQVVRSSARDRATCTRLQDKVMLEGAYPDPIYEARRRDVFVLAVNCTLAGGTCFCVSTNTGPGEHFEWAAEGTVASGAEVRFEEWAPVAGADDGGVLLAEVEISTA